MTEKFILVLTGKEYGQGRRLQQALKDVVSNSWWYLHVENVTQSKTVQFLKLADALIAVVPENSTGASKIGQYIGANKPIIVVGENINDPAADFIRDLNWGVVTNWEGLPSALSKLDLWAKAERRRRIDEFRPVVMKEYLGVGRLEIRQ